ncbi:MAG: 23S rRNA (guanosine(2251)-2'-O)-methyltransferase RlmB [Bacilli bacterium]|nr:23S rRNA (guanosine(2251)-2'-O)-methyltransferase RlmB [Bacilli bacterium]
MKIFGKNAIKEAINNPKKIKKITISDNFKDQEIINLIKDNNIKYEKLPSYILDKQEVKNQGIMAIIDDYEYYNIKDLLNDNIIVILDHLEDPHNLGAIIRTCEAAGINSIVIPKDRSVDVNQTVMKTSSGALNYMKIARVTNLVNTINILKDNNYFIYGADMSGIDYKKVSYSEKVVLVIGNEGKGISNLVRESCDEIISLPMNGHVNSLNASVAASILIYDLISR